MSLLFQFLCFSLSNLSFGAMEVSSSLSFLERKMRLSSVVEAMAVDTVLAAGKSLICLLILTGSLLTDITNHSVLPKLTTIDGRFPFDELSKGKHTYLKNKDASDSDEDEEEDDDDDTNDQDDEGGDEDLSGEEREEDADPEDDPEANGAGGSEGDDDDDDGDEDDDDDGEDEDDEEDEDEEEEEDNEPPPKRRK